MSHDQPITEDVTIPSDLGEIQALQDRIDSGLQALGYGENDRFKIRLTVEEALVNAMKHGNQLDPDKHVQVSYRITPERFDVRITDEGPGFTPSADPGPTDDRLLQRPGGRGLFIMRGFMDEVQYHGQGNVVTMSKFRRSHPPEPQ